MEERQREQQLLPHVGFVAALKVLGRHFRITLVHVGFEAFGWFGGQLDARLQHRHGKVVTRHGGQYETELRVEGGLQFGLLEALDALLQLRHEGASEVAILEDDPPAALDAGLDGPLGHDGLPLTQRDDGHLVAGDFACLGEPQQVREGIRPRRQDEDEWRFVIGVVVDLLDGGWDVGREALTQDAVDVIRHRVEGLLFTQGLHQHEPLEGRHGVLHFG